jgi:hypothetical protein
MAGTVPSLPTDERRVLKLLRNHAEFKRTLADLSLTAVLPDLENHVLSVGRAWLNLAREHLEDAKAAETSGRPRAVYSRAYYAAYNASKAVRYLVNGHVSLKGDDHQEAPNLPDDFPRVVHWSARVSELYQHRLRADYDNWANTLTEHSLPPADCLVLAEQFLSDSVSYLSAKFGVTL